MNDLSEHGHPGRIYGPRVGSGGKTARFEVFTDRISARDEKGELYTLHPGQVRAERSGNGVSLESADRSFALVVTDREGVDALRQDAPVDIREGVEGALGQVRRARGRDRRWLLVAALVFVLLGWGAYVGVMAAARAAVDQLPISIDREVGELAGDDLIPGVRPVEDAVVHDAIAEIVARLEPHAAIEGFEYRITVLDSPEVNAFALPGGRIFVLTGLIREAESPDQVAGVLAHEMAHVTLRHGMRSIVQSLGVIAAIEVLIGDLAGLSVLGVEGVRLLVEQGYSRDLESEADEEGVRMLHAAGIDPHGLARFFELLRGEEGASIPSWLGSHPELDDRIATVLRLDAEYGGTVVRPFGFDWQEVRSRVE